MCLYKTPSDFTCKPCGKSLCVASELPCFSTKSDSTKLHNIVGDMRKYTRFLKSEKEKKKKVLCLIVLTLTWRLSGQDVLEERASGLKKSKPLIHCVQSFKKLS